jgi:exonuclease III
MRNTRVRYAEAERLIVIYNEKRLTLSTPPAVTIWRRQNQKSTLDLTWISQETSNRFLKCQPQDHLYHGSDHIPISTIIS